MTLQLLLDTYRMVRSTFTTDGHRGGEDRARTALTLDHYALRTPLVGPSEWHLLNLVMPLEALENLHYLECVAKPARERMVTTLTLRRTLTTRPGLARVERHATTSRHGGRLRRAAASPMIGK